MTRTESIPITTNTKALRDEEEEQREAMRADYQDYIFYARLVAGMKQLQDKSRSVDLRYQNQALIDHITYTRNSESIKKTSLSFKNSFSRNDREKAAVYLSDTLALITDDECDMMFEMDI